MGMPQRNRQGCLCGDDADGGRQNDVLNHFTAELTGLSVCAGPAEGTALGNLAAQLISDGILSDLPPFRAMLSRMVDGGRS